MSIVATSQQSRFYTEAIETLSTDVDLKTVNLSVGDRDLLVNAHLKLSPGVHYGLIGRNGVGKSTLLKALGFRILVGLPKNLRILYVDQLEEVAASDKSVLETVLSANKEAVTAQKAVDLLEAALEGGRSEDVVSAVHEVGLLRLRDELLEAQAIATKRSGQRGLEARAYLVDVEQRLARAKEKENKEVSAEEVEAAASEAETLIADLTNRLSVLDVETAEARARKLLRGLGFTTAKIDGPLSQLSGGWRTRVALAQALSMEPDLLLLDEPTNNLDLPAILWLQDYLSALSNTTLVVVSHDRAFLNQTVEQIILLRHQTLSYYDGNYDEFEETVADTRVHQARVKENLDKKKDHIQKTIQKQLQQARNSGDDKKLNQVASRKKKLERTGVETNAKGHKFKLNRDRPGFWNSVRDEATVDGPDREVTWSFPQPLELKHQGPLVVLENVSFTYDSATPVGHKDSASEARPAGASSMTDSPAFLKTGVSESSTKGSSAGRAKQFVLTERHAAAGQTSQAFAGKKLVIKDCSMTVKQGARIALVGQNGQGKTTLLSLMADRLTPTSGSVKFHSQGKIGYFLQNHVQQLSEQKDTCALKLIQELRPEWPEQQCRAHLAGFGLQGSVVLQPVSSLSGGQAVRVSMAHALVHKPQLLLLDEPTNHLDMDTIKAMIENIAAYEGAVVLVSHDQHLVSSVADEVYEVRKGEVQLLQGGMSEYASRLSSRHAP